MQQLIVKNFGPIRDITLDVQDFMVFIGPQTSGKSTVVKLIYFFNDILSPLLSTLNNKNVKRRPIDGSDFLKKYKESIILYMEKIWGKNIREHVSGLSFKYSPDYTISIDIMKKETIITFGEDIDAWLVDLFDKTKSSQSSGSISSKIENILGMAIAEKLHLADNYIDFHYLPAERSAFSGSSNESDFFIEEFETLLNTIRADFTESDFENQADYLRKTGAANEFNSFREKIIKGKYKIRNYEEMILLNNSIENIPMHKASSGQQSAARLLAVLSYLMLQQDEFAVAIEEPELNLFPPAQREIINAIVYFFNITKSTVFLTTHSPYILTSLNNLIYAWQVGQVAPDEVRGHIPEACWLDPKRVGAYFLADGGIESIMDTDAEMIGVNELDEASGTIMDEFRELSLIRRKHRPNNPIVA